MTVYIFFIDLLILDYLLLALAYIYYHPNRIIILSVHCVLAGEHLFRRNNNDIIRKLTIFIASLSPKMPIYP